MSILRAVVIMALPLLFQSCYLVRPSDGGGRAKSINRKINIKDIALPKGFVIEPVTTGLTFPTGITFDDEGRLFVVESGYSYGEAWTEPRLLRINDDGTTVTVARGADNGPWNGVDFADGFFYISEGGQKNGGRILKVSKEGKITTLISDLPSKGDHHTNGPAVRDGFVYFGQGTATNSGVVGPDNASYGWLKRNPEFHDVPCKDIVLTGKNYESENVLTEDASDVATTGAFVPFNTSTKEGQVIQGRIPCSGAVMRVPVSGGEPELIAWGFRNPFSLTFREGKLFVADNGYDERGSRPVWGTGDILWEVEQNTWYGWPDYSGTALLDATMHKVPGKEKTDLLLKEKPGEIPDPIALLGVHSSSNGMDFSSSDQFGFKGMAFVAQFGDMAPAVGKVMAPVGFKVVMVDVNTGVIQDFAVNKGRKNGPASSQKKGGLERPIDVAFSSDGRTLYVVDFGIVEMSGNETFSHKGTGVVWKVTRSTTQR